MAEGIDYERSDRVLYQEKGKYLPDWEKNETTYLVIYNGAYLEVKYKFVSVTLFISNKRYAATICFGGEEHKVVSPGKEPSNLWDVVIPKKIKGLLEQEAAEQTITDIGDYKKE